MSSEQEDLDKFVDDFITEFEITAETATRIDNGGLNRETNGYMPPGEQPPK